MKKLCLRPVCGRIADKDTGYCSLHYNMYLDKLEKQKESQKGPEAYQRKLENRPYIKLYNSVQWKRMSKQKLNDNPICQDCEKRLSTEVDHITPHHGDLKLFFDYLNLQALCKSCHSKKTVKEQFQKSMKLD